ncbi:DUF294 nucleotidyltransferase-like domain-containing protein [Limibaculum sp. FT325]|uniref:DUF294 nucleotidyltransferase-like domain-containing protein n=1 Tax=Thermohalobaculum sediminis TaxID=2939436 RepID=UPI0020BE387C|nr:DUF294 nucleotidyltransferase-like domain-containing protein [Limibaculum sediminis]MCL5779118.1 DUF294 nucleotidyltransferase-like domain-containing protein [Limibaculum sediminis]
MSFTQERIERFLAAHHPFDALSADLIADCARAATQRTVTAGETIYAAGDTLPGLFLVLRGAVELTTPDGTAISVRHTGEIFARRGLTGDGTAPDTAKAREHCDLLILPVADFRRMLDASDQFRAFFERIRVRVAAARNGRGDGELTTLPVRALMTAQPVTVPSGTAVRDAARVMSERHISCVLVAEPEGALEGILTTGDLTGRVLARGLPPETPVREVMTRTPLNLSPDALGFDAFLTMAERHIGHLPVTEDGRPVGIITRTNLVNRQTVSSIYMVSEIARAETVGRLAETVGAIPQLLAQLVGGGAEPHVVTRLVTDVGDAVTRRLLVMAERELGPAPRPWLWLACGSQGRREQTGVSDQDNCLILDDAATEADDDYFAAFAKFVSDGLDACGYYYCPGEMMATNPRWRQPVRVWRQYFDGWIRKPDPMAQMLASVMFDLRPIAGTRALFDGLQAETLARARANSIFVAHMISNSLKHTPPLGLFRGFALIRSGEHKDTVDLKLNGVVPVVDLGRIYALIGALEPVNTRERLIAAREAGVLSDSGAHDLLDAYDLIAGIRLEHQARQVREGRKPDNFMAPATLSELERGHLKDAFMVIKTMQSALAHSRGAPG